MSGIALGAAYAAVQLVHQAYSKVKTSKARCARLVGRCQFVVDRLERIAATKGGDSIIRERIYELEWAFQQTARTIVQVGQQGIVVSLLRAEANALRIQACNEALTELISLFNLEEIVDVRRWQTDLEIARVRDHHELLNMGHRIESDNAAINRELAQQGATITQVLKGIHDINAGLRNTPLGQETLKRIAIPLTITDILGPGPRPMATLSRTSRHADRNLNLGLETRLWLPTSGTPIPRTSAPLPKAKVTGTESSTLYTACSSPRTAAKPGSSALRQRLTLTRKCVKMVPLTKVLSSKRTSCSSPIPPSSYSRSAHPARESSSPSTAPKANVKCGAMGKGISGSFVSSQACCPPALEPPPPYQLRVANPAPASEYDSEYDHNIHGHGHATSSSSRFTAASVEAIRAPDSPVPAFPSPKLSTESVFGGSTTRSLESISDSESAPLANNTANGTGATTISEPRYIATLRLRNSAARDATGPALRRKETIGFARRRVTLSSSGYVKPTVSSAAARSLKPLVRGRKRLP